MKIAIAADLHIGANKFGTSNEKWAEPMVELVDYAIAHEVDAVAFAGDLFHHRRPTTWASQFVSDQLFRLTANDIKVLGADGNHDDGVALDTVSASWFIGDNQWARKVPTSMQWGSEKKLFPEVNIVLLPWVTPAAFDAPTDTSLPEQLEWAQTAALDTIKGMLTLESAGVVNLLIGHAMVAYGKGQDDLAPSPGLQWAGKDVVFDFGTLTKMFNGGVYLGHVHDPRMQGYVGSSQPTDWGDAEQTKSFTVLEITDPGNGPAIHTDIVPYETSLRLLDVKENEFTGLGFHSSVGGALDFKYDVGRYSYHEDAEVPLSAEELAGIRTRMEAVCDRVESIEITRDRVTVQRVATDTPLAAMRPEDAADAWIRHASLDPEVATDVKAKFQSLLEADAGYVPTEGVSEIASLAFAHNRLHSNK